MNSPCDCHRKTAGSRFSRRSTTSRPQLQGREQRGYGQEFQVCPWRRKKGIIDRVKDRRLVPLGWIDLDERWIKTVIVPLEFGPKHPYQAFVAAGKTTNPVDRTDGNPLLRQHLESLGVDLEGLGIFIAEESGSVVLIGPAGAVDRTRGLLLATLPADPVGPD